MAEHNQGGMGQNKDDFPKMPKFNINWLYTIIIIGLALSMDAFAVCLSSAVIYPGISKRQSLSMPLAFPNLPYLRY